jgi:hypothetical protein
MEPRRVSVFFYGLFMDAELLVSKGFQPVHPRPALRIGQRATLIPSEESFAYGIIMELSHAEIEQLYSEASVSAYRPEAVLARLPDGTNIPAMCFNLVVPPAQEEVNPEYAAKLRELARKLELPLQYVESIR